MADSVLILPCLHELASLGIQLALDDFGTGDSSLGNRNRFPLHTLKADKTFISGTEAEPERLFSGEDCLEALLSVAGAARVSLP
ncbi:Cyclic di-GMP phosphodiesterase Gmr [compost metagenome]